MAWFYNGRKYWYHNGKKYSRRVKKHYYSSDRAKKHYYSSENVKKYNFSYSSDINRYHSDLEKNEDAWMDALDSIDSINNKKNNYNKNIELELEKANDDYLDMMYNDYNF